MVTEITWEEFRKSGLLWWINSLLHVFGMAICVELIEDEIVRVFPARVKFRGFSENITTNGYIKLSKYLVENAIDLLKEAEEKA